jgi:hypothetical protein
MSRLTPWTTTIPRISLFALLLLCGPAARAFLYDGFASGPGWPNRVDDYIDNVYAVSPLQPVDIIVDFCSTPTAADSTFLASYGAVYKVFRFIGAIAVRGVIAADCYLITNYPRVKLVEWDETITPLLDVSCRAIQARSSPAYPYPAQAVWDLNPPVGYMGNGVNIAIIDSGVDDGHPALAGKFIAGYNGFTGQGGPGVNPDDDMINWYHGTAVAGMIMANDPSQMYMGVAPMARLIDCKIFDNAGTSPASRVIATILWCMNNAQAYGIDIINMSIGGRGSDGSDALSRAADAAAIAGIITVASAGNTPPVSGISSPGAGDGVITVGGVSDAGTIWRGDDFFHPASRTGPRVSPPPTYQLAFNDLKPEVTAYMDAIVTCLGSNPGQGGAGWWQHPGVGTSWATAHTTGVIALLVEKYPGIPPSQVETLLRVTAETRGTPDFPWLSPTFDTQFGWGIVSAAAAVNAVLPVDISVKAWTPGSWNSQSIWAGHYPVRVGDPNTLNARIYATGGPAANVGVTFSVMQAGWGAPWVPVGSATVNVPWGGSAVATIPFTPPPGMEGHKCFLVTASYPADTNPANNSAQENMDVQPLRSAALASRDIQRYAFPVTMCVEPTATVPFRTADACICTKDLPPGVEAWLEPEPPFDLMPGQCQPCSLIVQASGGIELEPGDAVYVNGWFWGNGVAEGGVAIHFGYAPPIEATINEVQYTEDPIAPSPLTGQRVTVSGIATTDEWTYPERYAIQDDSGPWSGLFVRQSGAGVARGDDVTVTGTVVETEGLTEIAEISEISVHGSGHPVPLPEVLGPGVIDASESYEGVLVRAENATVVDAGDPTNWQVASDGTCRVGRWGAYFYMPVLGDRLHITGVVGALAESHKLQPRDDADIEAVSSAVDSLGLPAIVSLSQNRPNPFHRSTAIAFALPAAGDVELRVFNVNGQLVRTLIDGKQAAGYWRVNWDGRDNGGRQLPSGVYFCSLKAGGKAFSRQMSLLK